MPKRKRGGSAFTAVAEPSRKKRSSPTCMIHDPSKSAYGHFTALSKVKGIAMEKLQYLHGIRDRRLRQPHGSSYRMQSVCNQIPATLPDDFESTGYHRQCYQGFTCNLHLMGDGTESEPSTSVCRSPRRRSTPGSLFPPECIFCRKEEIKGPDRKTERSELFSSRKNKQNAWEQMESQAEKMGLSRLHRLVKGVDLFSAEAKYHNSCFKSFRTSSILQLRAWD